MKCPLSLYSAEPLLLCLLREIYVSLFLMKVADCCPACGKGLGRSHERWTQPSPEGLRSSGKASRPLVPWNSLKQWSADCFARGIGLSLTWLLLAGSCSAQRSFGQL